MNISLCAESCGCTAIVLALISISPSPRIGVVAVVVVHGVDAGGVVNASFDTTGSGRADFAHNPTIVPIHVARQSPATVMRYPVSTQSANQGLLRPSHGMRPASDDTVSRKPGIGIFTLISCAAVSVTGQSPPRRPLSACWSTDIARVTGDGESDFGDRQGVAIFVLQRWHKPWQTFPCRSGYGPLFPLS